MIIKEVENCGIYRYNLFNNDNDLLASVEFKDISNLDIPTVKELLIGKAGLDIKDLSLVNFIV